MGLVHKKKIAFWPPEALGRCQLPEASFTEGGLVALQTLVRAPAGVSHSLPMRTEGSLCPPDICAGVAAVDHLVMLLIELGPSYSRPTPQSVTTDCHPGYL